MNLTIVERDGQGKIVSNRVAKRDQRPRYVNLTLMGRRDLALHFLVSAAVTVSAGGGMADLLGVFKEMADAQGGSGFSFADLAADQAGVRLAKLAMGSLNARSLQQRMNQELKETDFMPRVDQLPVSIMELEFERRYRDLDSATYKIVDDEIERRIAECRIYK